jgi:hypothetical protein
VSRWERLAHQGGPGESHDQCSTRSSADSPVRRSRIKHERKLVDHKGTRWSRCSRAVDDRGGRSPAEGEPVDSEPVAIGRHWPQSHVAHSEHPPLPASRRRRVAATGRRMTIRKQPSGQWFAVLKSGRAYVNGRTFSTRRDAQAWLARERAALAGGIDPVLVGRRCGPCCRSGWRSDSTRCQPRRTSRMPLSPGWYRPRLQ